MSAIVKLNAVVETTFKPGLGVSLLDGPSSTTLRVAAGTPGALLDRLERFREAVNAAVNEAIEALETDEA
jgi:hypothetical protein